MRLKIIKKMFQYSGIAGLAFSAGCAYMPPNPKPDLLGNYPTISHKSTALLEKPSEKINVEIIHDREKKLPTYSGERFELKQIGDYNIIRYHVRNMDSDSLKKTLEEQLVGGVDAISSVPSTNQILIKIKRNDDSTSGGLSQYIPPKQIEEVINTIDVSAPQIMLDLRIVKVFADYSKDISAFLNLTPKEDGGLYPEILANLPGAKLRVPERAAELGLGVKYGVVGEIGRYFINAQLDQLESLGFAEDLAATSLVVSNGRKAEIRLTQELPYKDEVFQGGAILALTKYKEIDNFLELTPFARDNGSVFMNISAGVGSYNPTGVLQIPGIVKRNVKVDGVEIKQGETIVLGGFKIDHTLAIERKDHWLSHIPVLGYLFRASDKEKSRNEVLFIATPYYVDVNSKRSLTLDDDVATTRTEE